jgi:ATP/maltotriose-dependent transcriptional regulator MalT
VEDAGYPVQLAKVQPPALRSETLERPRLLDWLASRIHRRVVLVLADAGFGKSTLLADFARRTRLPTLWYRLDDNDRDWLSLVHHIVASGRQHLPDFAPQTAALLQQTGPSGPDRDRVVSSLLSELPQVAANGAVLIFDDFHEVDDAEDARYVVRELLASAPERMAIVFSSRQLPSIPIARLRSAGEVAELATDDLRFDVAETTELFNVTYGREIEPDVLVDLTNRTEGWIASLHMVQAALRDRTPAEIRRFVRSLSGADRDMYDFLAEEVVGDLPDDLQAFLMRTSILQVVTPELAQVATGNEAPAVTRLTTAAERLTLLSRSTGTTRTYPRYHPLVREFLESRLKSLEGHATVAALHRRIAVAAERVDWRTAAYHHREGGDTNAMLDVVGSAIPTIMGNGQYALAEAFIGSIDPEVRPARFDLILSRVDMQQGDYDAAIAASQAVLNSNTVDAIERDHALLNLVTLYLNYGDGDRAIEFAEKLSESTDSNLANIANASIAMVTGSETDNIDRINRMLIAMSRTQRGPTPHHFAVTQYNLASNYVVQDKPGQALEVLDAALELLESGSAAMELAAARVLQAQSLAMLGREEQARAALALLRDIDPDYREDEVEFGIADLLDSFLDPVEGRAAFSALDLQRSSTPSGKRIASLSMARMLTRSGRFEDAEAALSQYPDGRPAHLGIESARWFTRAYLEVARGNPDSLEVAIKAAEHARLQGAHRWRRCSELLAVLRSDAAVVSSRLSQLGRESPQTLTYIAELVARHLGDLDEAGMRVAVAAATLHPQRWRVALREVVDQRLPSAAACGYVLEEIGEKSDIHRLRRLAHELKRKPEAGSLGRRLARRLADEVFIEDQGRVSFRIGQRVVMGSDVRRKVLALTCFLLSRPQMSCTRDQVLEAIWPDLDPEVAVNSLNQTLYFLRRVFESKYQEDLSPGYVHHDSDVIWLDPELVSSRSVACRALVRSLPPEPTPTQVEELVQLYRGRFALDFEYEEWAATHRDTIHAAYLEVVERSVLSDFVTGHHDRGIHVARRVLEVDSLADTVEVSLLRLYLVTGAHAAAAEQYAHYSSVMRDELGIEPPPLESL